MTLKVYHNMTRSQINARALIDQEKKLQLEKEINRKNAEEALRNDKHTNCLHLVEKVESLIQNPIRKNGYIREYHNEKHDSGRPLAPEKYYYKCDEFTNLMNETNRTNKFVKVNVNVRLPMWKYDTVNSISTDIDTQNDVITYTLS